MSTGAHQFMAGYRIAQAGMAAGVELVDQRRTMADVWRELFNEEYTDGHPLTADEADRYAEAVIAKFARANPVRIATLEQTCGACPSQWEGTTEDGRSVYIRYRHGYLTASVGPDEDAAVDAGGNLYGGEHGEPLDGVMTTDEMYAHLAGVIVAPGADQ